MIYRYFAHLKLFEFFMSFYNIDVRILKFAPYSCYNVCLYWLEEKEIEIEREKN